MEMKGKVNASEEATKLAEEELRCTSVLKEKTEGGTGDEAVDREKLHSSSVNARREAGKPVGATPREE